MKLTEWLGSNELSTDIWEKKYRHNNESLDEFFDRISNGNEEFRTLLIEKKVIPAGRTLTNRGVDNGASLSNCYSSGYCPDDVSGIFELAKDVALTFKGQGGQGISLSKVRPRGTNVSGGYTSDGIIPFMQLFNTTTDSMKQGGNRRGALLMSLDVRHKDASDFIKLKSNSDMITRANLSLEIDDEFMEAVDKYYSTGEIITLHEHRKYGSTEINYDVVPIELFKLLAQTSYDWGEPAVLFTNRLRNYNLMEYSTDYKIVTVNPCGEQPLPKDGCCALIAINVAEFISGAFTKEAEFDFDAFANAVRVAVEVENEIIDEGIPRHPLLSQRYMAEKNRNIGVGICGLSTAFLKLGYTYGDKASIEFCHQLGHLMINSAANTSAKLATIDGPFDNYSSSILDSHFAKNNFDEDTRKNIETFGLRNCSLLSFAPTGSIGTMLNVSTGIEPVFSFSYKRRTENLKESYDVFSEEVTQYWDVNHVTKKNRTIDTLPSYFVTAADIPWKNRVDIQATLQSYVDTGISSTVNLPENTTVEEIEQLYLYAWKQGLKGITIFRDNCKRVGILLKDTTAEETVTSSTSTVKEQPIDLLRRGMIETVPQGLTYRKYKLFTGCGKLYLFVGIDEADNRIYDIFCNTDSETGGCPINIQAVSRLISACIRGGIPLQYVIDQLNGAGSCPSYQFARGSGRTVSKGKSCASAIAHVLKDINQELEEYIRLENSEELETITDKVVSEVLPSSKSDVVLKRNSSTEDSLVCEVCGEIMVSTGGCFQCPSCGNSRCGD